MARKEQDSCLHVQTTQLHFNMDDGSFTCDASDIGYNGHSMVCATNPKTSHCVWFERQVKAERDPEGEVIFDRLEAVDWSFERSKTKVTCMRIFND